MKAIVRWALWQRRWSIFWWSLGLLAFVGLELSVYNSVKGQAQQLNQALAHLPPSVKTIFGANVDLFSPVGYLNSRLFNLMLPLLLSILSIGIGSSLLAREESSGTLELLLARPISRSRLVLAKAWAGLINILIVWLVATAGTLALVWLVKMDISLKYVALTSVDALLLVLVFGGLAYCLTAMGLSRASSLGLSTLVALGSFVIASLEADVHWFHWPAKFLPYHYYNSLAALQGRYDWWSFGGLGGVLIVLLALADRAFRRRDIG